MERSKLALAWCKGREGGGERRETASTCERGQMIFAINGRPGWGIASIGLPETVPGDDVNARRPRRPSRRRRWLDYSPNRMKKRDSSRGPPLLIEVMRGQRALLSSSPMGKRSSLNETWRNARHKFRLGSW